MNSFHVREYSESELVSLLGRHFASLALYGQNPCRAYWVKGLTAVARMTSTRIAARANSALQHARYLRGGNDAHRVEKADKRFAYEYIVYVCSDQGAGDRE